MAKQGVDSIRLQALLAQMRQKWPSAAVARSQVGDFSGGVLNPRTMANLDSLGQGPRERYSMGRTVFYPVDALLDLIRERVENGDL